MVVEQRPSKQEREPRLRVRLDGRAGDRRPPRGPRQGQTQTLNFARQASWPCPRAANQVPPQSFVADACCFADGWGGGQAAGRLTGMYIHMGQKHGAGKGLDRTGWMRTARHIRVGERDEFLMVVAAAVVLRGDGLRRGEAAELSVSALSCPWTTACCVLLHVNEMQIPHHHVRLMRVPCLDFSSLYQQLVTCSSTLWMYTCMCGMVRTSGHTYTDNPTYAPACPDLHDRFPLSTRF